MTGKIRIFLQAIKIEHSIFALPFAYLGWILGSSGHLRWDTLGWVTLVMVSFRTLAMGLNRLFDQRIDAANPRTASRALPTGQLSSRYVWTWCIACLLVYVWSTYQLSPLCFKLSGIPVFLVFLYPFMKRMSWFAHVVLGLVLGIAPYGAWLAAGRDFSWIPGLFSLGVIFWVTGFDIIYALQDEQFDRSYGLHSFPARFGSDASLAVTSVLHTLTVVAWVAAGAAAGLGWIYFAGMGIVVLFLVREHWLIYSFGAKKIHEAFFTMNAVVSAAVFVAVILDTVILRSMS